MTREEMIKLADPTTFQPFVIVTGSGQRFVVPHPEYIDIPPLPEEEWSQAPSYVTVYSRGGVMHFRVKGKRSKIRFVPVNAAAQRMIEDYLALTGHRSDVEGALFRPVKNNRTGRLDRHLDPASVYQNIVRKYGR